MRGREPQRRAAPARSDWDRGRDRDRDPPRTARKSGSPIKSKLMAMAMSSGRDRDGKPTTSSRKERESSKDRAVQKRRLRMDEHEDRGGKRERSPERHRDKPDTSQKRSGPPASSLDKVVKKAREERNNYWDKKIIEAEEKDPDRWGHSGFKELYHKKDAKKGPTVVKRGRSRSGSSPRRNRRSRSGSVGFARRRPVRSKSRSLSRSRSPIHRIPPNRKHLRSSRSLSPPGFSKSKNIIASKSRGNVASNKLDTRNIRHTNFQSKSKLSASAKHARPLMLSKPKSSGVIQKGRHKQRSSSFFSSGSSISRSRSRSYKASSSKRLPRSRQLPKGKSNKSGAALSSYSSSSSSEDEDVLQLHAKGRNRSSSFSHSDSGSSSSSKSNGKGAKRKGSSSSSETQSSSDSDSDISIRAKPILTPAANKSQKDKPATVKKVTATVTAGEKAKKPEVKSTTSAVLKTPSKSTDKAITKKATGTDIKSNIPKIKPTTITTSNKSLNKPKKPTAAPSKTSSTDKDKSVSKKVSKPPSESGETASESDSDSDSEPRMTLSERFAKLSQMSTDKREMAKPVLAVNEIDTKMRVVKDFRNPEAPKVYVAGDAGSQPADKSKPPRNRSPPLNDEFNRRRDTSEERRRNFDRMTRDAPADRPIDWMDAKVRFNYYKTRGCFDQRPISFEEYVKWEDWYHKYRDWLEQEGYYGNDGRPPPPHNSGNWNFNNGPHGISRPGPESGSRIPMSQRIGHGSGDPNHFGQPLNSNRTNFGRPEAHHQRIGRHIDSTPGGSLMINIRPGYNGNGFDARRRLGRFQ